MEVEASSDSSPQNTSVSSCHTKIKTETFSYKWIIENFVHCKTDKVVSSEFAIGKKATWYHQLLPTSNSRQIDIYTNIEIGMFIKSCDSTHSLHGTVKIQKNEQTFTSTGFLQAGCSLGTPMKISRAEVLSKEKGFLIDKNLELCFEFTLTQNLPSYGGNAQIPVPDSQLLPNLTSLFSDDKFSDITVIVGTEEFPCHKAILAVRSSVFAAMFEHKMRESNQNRIVITDIEPRVFRELLRFIYTDEVRHLDKIAFELLPAADKYAIDRLKSLCEQCLYANLCVESAIETLVLADLHQCGQLKQQSIAFINRNAAAFAMENWKGLCAKRWDLVSEIFMARSVG